MSYLVLSRSEQQSIIITTGAGERVVMTVQKLANGQVRLGFNAPKSVEIWRSEVLGVVGGEIRRE